MERSLFEAVGKKSTRSSSGKETRRKTHHALAHSQGSLGGMVLCSYCLHLDLDKEYDNRTQQRSTLPFSATETSQGCHWGVRFFVLDWSHTKWQKGKLLARFLLDHHEWHCSSPSQNRRQSKATSVTPALLTAPRSSLLQSYTTA